MGVSSRPTPKKVGVAAGKDGVAMASEFQLLLERERLLQAEVRIFIGGREDKLRKLLVK